MDLDGVDLTLVQRDQHFVLSRAKIGELNGTALILKPVSARPSLAVELRLKNELALAPRLHADWAILPTAIGQHGGQDVLVLSDPGGSFLPAKLASSIELGDFLLFAVGLATAVARLHNSGLIHRDIRPANVVIGASGGVLLTGFGVATADADLAQSSHPEAILSDIRYMAPEQTGRTPYAVDARSDLYSTGITLYELLTGHLPFAADGSLEWIHCHVARQPLLPSQRRHDTPLVLEHIIMKLLAKSPDDRYQTAIGLHHDLSKCLVAWRQSQTIEPFPIAESDTAPHAQTSSCLYGRDTELTSLLLTFDRVSNTGRSEAVLIGGYSGVGKSTVAAAFQARLRPTNAIWAAGKYDQDKRHVPYATLAQAFQGVLRRLLGIPEETLDRWRSDLLDALTPNAQLIVNIVPELGLIIGPQPPVSDQSPLDQEKRFRLVLKDFIKVLGRQDHPLVLFLDDLQWADPATLSVLSWIVSDPEIRHVLLVGAYRDNEVGTGHPLILALEAARSAGATLQTLNLGPLAKSDIADLVSDILRSRDDEVSALADLVYTKAGGNPFFTTHFLRTLSERRLIYYDATGKKWTWIPETIEVLSVSDNVADLIKTRLRGLGGELLDLVKTLACIGHSTPSWLLFATSQLPKEALANAISDLQQAQIIRYVENGYAFAHDRIQQAAYELLADDERVKRHLQIGRILASSAELQEHEALTFEAVNQLSRGLPLIDTATEREQLAILCLKAGLLAKAAVAYHSSLQYLDTGSGLLSPEAWAADYQTAFGLHFHAADCRFLLGDVEAAERAFADLAARDINVSDLALVVGRQVLLYTYSGQIIQAIHLVIDCLKRLGIHIPEQPSNDDVGREYADHLHALDGRPVDVLLELPLMTDRRLRVVMYLLEKLNAPAGILDANLRDLVNLRMITLSLTYGSTDETCHGLVCLGYILGFRFGDFDAARRYGMFGISLMERRNLDRYAARVHGAFAALVVPWVLPLRQSYVNACKAFDIGLQTGDITWASYAWWTRAASMFDSGQHLEDVYREAMAGLDYANVTQFVLAAELTAPNLYVAKALRGLTHDLGSFNDGTFDEITYERYLATTPHLISAQLRYLIRKLQVRFYARQIDDCIELIATIEPRIDWYPTFETAEFRFFAALTRAAILKQGKRDDRQQMMDALAADHRLLAAWALSNPSTFWHRARLVEAEIAALEGREREAMSFYEDALKGGKDAGYIQNAALASELAARFHLSCGLKTSALAYLERAQSLYTTWGAIAKASGLEAQFPELWADAATDAVDPSRVSLDQLDTATVVKVARAISGQVHLDALCSRLLEIALEHSSAGRAALVLQVGEQVQLVADAVVVRDSIEVQLRSKQLATALDLPLSIVNLTRRTGDMVVLGDAALRDDEDEYIRARRPRAVVCLPLTPQSDVIGLLYLESQSASIVFTPTRLSILRYVALQAALAIQNARLYQDVEHATQIATQAESELRVAFDMIPALAWSTSADGQAKELNQRWLDYCGLQSRTPDAAQWIECFHPEDREVLRVVWQECLDTGTPGEVEVRMRRADGQYRTFLVRATPMRDLSGHVVKWFGTNTDIEELKCAERTLAEERLRLSISVAEKESLLREVHHRVKNNLQLISSLLSLAASRSGEPAIVERFAESRTRIQSMALVHENLYRAGNFARVAMSDHISILCSRICAAYGARGREISVETKVDNVSLDLDSAVCVGLIVNELVSNSLKHAFSCRDEGHIEVKLRRITPSLAELSVRDDGIGFDQALTAGDGMGLELVNDLTAQLAGKLLVETKHGTTVSVQFPVLHAEVISL